VRERERDRGGWYSVTHSNNKSIWLQW